MGTDAPRDARREIQQSSRIIMTGLEPEECIFRFPTFLPLPRQVPSFLSGLSIAEGETPSTLAFASLVNDPSRFRPLIFVGRRCRFGCLTFVRRAADSGG